MSTKPILHDHKRQGRRLVPPLVYELGNVQETSWIRTIIPEVCWLALLQTEFGYQRCIQITTLLARVSRALSSEFSCIPFCSISHYAAIPDNLWPAIRHELARKACLFDVQKALMPLITLYPETPFHNIFLNNDIKQGKNSLATLKQCIKMLFLRSEKNSMMVQANVVWLAFDAGILKVQEGLPLAEFPEIEYYPNTELSRKIGSCIRAMLNGFFGPNENSFTSGRWPTYFWNRGLVIEECDFGE